MRHIFRILFPFVLAEVLFSQFPASGFAQGNTPYNPGDAQTVWVGREGSNKLDRSAFNQVHKQYFSNGEYKAGSGLRQDSNGRWYIIAVRSASALGRSLPVAPAVVMPGQAVTGQRYCRYRGDCVN